MMIKKLINYNITDPDLTYACLNNAYHCVYRGVLVMTVDIYMCHQSGVTMFVCVEVIVLLDVIRSIYHLQMDIIRWKCDYLMKKQWLP